MAVRALIPVQEDLETELRSLAHLLGAAFRAELATARGAEVFLPEVEEVLYRMLAGGVIELGENFDR